LHSVSGVIVEPVPPQCFFDNRRFRKFQKNCPAREASDTPLGSWHVHGPVPHHRVSVFGRSRGHLWIGHPDWHGRIARYDTTVRNPTTFRLVPVCRILRRTEHLIEFEPGHQPLPLWMRCALLREVYEDVRRLKTCDELRATQARNEWWIRFKVRLSTTRKVNIRWNAVSVGDILAPP
jgi:hypothetical protein